MNGKILISCDLIVLTGMHIGGNDTFSAIGAVDSPVIRDARTGRPIVPGSSLKGKLRSLLASSKAKDIENLPDCNNDDNVIKRIFGSSVPVHAARAQFSDCFVSNYDEMKNIGLTEVKFENSISRSSSTAMPRQIERVNPGVKFKVTIIYNTYNDIQTKEDMTLLAYGMKLLQMDYLGGHGSRGSGRVNLCNFEITDGESEHSSESKKQLDNIRNIFKDAEQFNLFPNFDGEK